MAKINPKQLAALHRLGAFAGPKNKRIVNPADVALRGGQRDYSTNNPRRRRWPSAFFPTVPTDHCRHHLKISPPPLADFYDLHVSDTSYLIAEELTGKPAEALAIFRIGLSDQTDQQQTYQQRLQTIADHSPAKFLLVSIINYIKDNALEGHINLLKSGIDHGSVISLANIQGGIPYFRLYFEQAHTDLMQLKQGPIYERLLAHAYSSTKLTTR